MLGNLLPSWFLRNIMKGNFVMLIITRLYDCKDTKKFATLICETYMTQLLFNIDLLTFCKSNIQNIFVAQNTSILARFHYENGFFYTQKKKGGYEPK